MLLVTALTITFSSLSFYRQFIEQQRNSELKASLEKRNAELERDLAERQLQRAPK